MNKANVFKIANGIEKMNKELINALQVSKAIINRFDNKVVNARLKNAINEEIAKLHENPIFVVSLFTERYCQRIKIFCNKNRNITLVNGNNIYLNRDYTNIYYKVDEDNRLNAKETIQAIEREIECLQNEIAAYADAVTNWEEYERQTKEIEAKIKEYNEKCNYIVRRMITIDRDRY